MMNSSQLQWLNYLIRKRNKDTKQNGKITRYSCGIYLNRYGKWTR